MEHAGFRLVLRLGALGALGALGDSLHVRQVQATRVAPASRGWRAAGLQGAREGGSKGRGVSVTKASTRDGRPRDARSLETVDGHALTRC